MSARDNKDAGKKTIAPVIRKYWFSLIKKLKLNKARDGGSPKLITYNVGTYSNTGKMSDSAIHEIKSMLSSAMQKFYFELSEEACKAKLAAKTTEERETFEAFEEQIEHMLWHHKQRAEFEETVRRFLALEARFMEIKTAMQTEAAVRNTRLV